MKILVVCQHYWPESFQITAVCEDLVTRGHEITVLTGLPNYPSGVIPEEYRHGQNRRQEKDGVCIIRAREIGRKSGAVGLALNYYSYALSAKSIARKLDDSFDVVFAYQLSPVMMAQPAIEYKKRAGVPMLLYCCDLWPESMKVLLGNSFRSLVKHYEKVSQEIYSRADIIAVQSDAFIDYFMHVHGIERERLHYIPQFAADKYLDQDFSCDAHDGVNFVFLGNIGRAQDIPCILNAISKMRHKEGFTVHFVGDGACLKESKEAVASQGFGNRVVFHGRRPFDEMPNYYRLADACLLTLEGSTEVGTTLPSKLQGYMAAGKPILAAINGGARTVIDESGCGEAVDAGDSDGLAYLMDTFIEDRSSFRECGQKGRMYFKERFLKQRHMDDIEHLLLDICERGRHA